MAVSDVPCGNWADNRTHESTRAAAGNDVRAGSDTALLGRVLHESGNGMSRGRSATGAVGHGSMAGGFGRAPRAGKVAAPRSGAHPRVLDERAERAIRRGSPDP